MVPGVQAVQVAWQLKAARRVGDVPELVVPGVVVGRAVEAQGQDVPAVEAAEVPGVAAGMVVVNVKQVDWMPVASGRGHSVYSMEFDPN